jgi:hypothetical protein
MLLDYLRNIFRLDLTVPNTFRIYEDGDSDRAEADRAALGEHDFAHRIAALRFFSLSDTFQFEDPLELRLHLRCPDLRAGLSRAYEDVPFDRRLHHRRELFELVVIVYEFWFCHSCLSTEEHPFYRSGFRLCSSVQRAERLARFRLFYFATNRLGSASKNIRRVVESIFDFAVGSP